MSITTTVFISYSHDSDEHRKQVLELSERLRLDGIETLLDQYVNGTPKEGWPRWTMNQVRAADYVLVVCTETYYRRFRGLEVAGKGKGVDWEASLITTDLYDARSQSLKFVPIFLSSVVVDYIPDPLRSVSYYALESESDYQLLYDFLLQQAGVEPGPVGTPKARTRQKGTALTFDPSLSATRPTDISRSIGRPGIDRKFLVHLLAFTVTLGAGIGPLLGLIRAPGFVSIGELFPLNLQRAVAPFGAFLHTLPAIGLPFFGGVRFRPGRLALVIAFVALSAGILTLYLAYTSWVVPVEVGGNLTAAYVVGPTMLPDCPCVARKVQITSCIGPVIDTNPAHVEDCYPRGDIVARKNKLSLLYFFAMFSLGVLIGLVVLRERMQRGTDAEL